MTQCNRSTAASNQKSPARRRSTARAMVFAAVMATMPMAACQTATAEPPASVAQAAPATVDQGGSLVLADLQAAALDALKHGELDATSELIEQAAAVGDDPTLLQMRDWINDFQAQRAKFEEGRRAEMAKQVARVHMLDEAGYLDYAAQFAGGASRLAEDAESFRAEEWVDELTKRAEALAEEYAANQQWAKAVTLYADLNTIDPYNARWNERFKDAGRRIRVLAMYGPERLKEVQEAEQARREEVTDLLDQFNKQWAEAHPEEAEANAEANEIPTTQPAEENAEENGDEPAIEEEDDTFATDWRDTLKDVNRSMVEEALEFAYQRYRQNVSYRELVIGGLEGIDAVLTTQGVEESFPEAANAEHLATLRTAVGVAMENARTQTVDRNFVWRALQMLEDVNARSVQLPTEVLNAEFADGAFGELDQFSSMIWPSEVAEFNKNTQGSFFGVGISIRTSPEGDLTVVSPLEDSPAFDAGIRAGDIISHIDGKRAKNISTTQAVKTITGLQGTDVVLTIKRETEEGPKTFDVTLTRSKIDVKSIKGWRHLPGGGWEYLIDPEQKIGYLRITQFSASTTDDLRAALKQLETEGARGVILDLRYNPGGLLSSAAEVADMFLDGGRIVSTKSERDLREQAVLDARKQRSDIDLPLAVLVNEMSASASEIVSGALRDRNRATVVGMRTFGKGSVQMLFPVGRGAARLKLTTSHYYLPNGESIHKDEMDREWGVDPDLQIEMTTAQIIAAQEARNDLDILQRVGENPTTRPIEQLQKNLLDSDPQLSAALLVLRLQLAADTNKVAVRE